MSNLWKDSLSVSNATLDDHHKKLFVLFDDLHEAMKVGKATSVVEGILRDIKDYTKYHFAYEEEQLAKKRYPNLAQHKEAHRKFIGEIDTLIQKASANELSASIETNKILSEWLRGHIMGKDQDYVGYLKE